LRAPYAEPPVVEGSVYDLMGVAINGAQVVVASRPLTGGAWRNERSVATNAQGEFRVRLAGGVSREVRFTSGDSERSVKLLVAAPIRLRAHRLRAGDGRTITFSGTVPGSERTRIRVNLQTWAGRWVPFRTATLKSGQFSARYRFASPTRFRFRAVIRSHPAFPYAGGRSPTVDIPIRL
jgi:hypothetical protein